MFEADIEGQLEIHSGSMASSILEDTISCARLRVDQVDDSFSDIAISSNLEMECDAASTLGARQPVSA